MSRPLIVSLVGAFTLLSSSAWAAHEKPTLPAADAATTPAAPERASGETSFSFITGIEAPSGRVGTGPDGAASDVLGLRVTLAVDFGVRVTPRLRLSGRVTGLMGGLGDTFHEICDAGRTAAEENPDSSSGDSPTKNETCGHFGGAGSVHLRYDFRRSFPEGGLAPYVAYGVGYEYVHMIGSTGKSQEASGSFEGSLSGVNVAMPELGVEIRTSAGMSLALFASAKVGRYLSRSGTVETLDQTADAQYGGGAFHTWFGGGLALMMY